MDRTQQTPMPDLATLQRQVQSTATQPETPTEDSRIRRWTRLVLKQGGYIAPLVIAALSDRFYWL